MPAETTQRASADALLALTQKEHRGRLKIFLGAAPGVGKTYAMLSAGRAAKADGRTSLDPQVLAGLHARYEAAVTIGITHNRHRDWHDGNHPGYTLATWLTKHADQVWLFTTNFAVDWTSNAAERGIKPAKRHQAVSGYWRTAKTLARWCLINSYLTSARNHGLTVLDAITRALNDNPWLPQHALA